MINQLLMGLWICAVTLGGIYAGDFLVAEGGAGTKVGTMEYVTNEPMTVPIVTNGSVEGYVIAKLIFSADSEALKPWGDKLKLVFSDSAFRIIYAGERERVYNQKRQDLDNMVEEIKARTNQALGNAVVENVLVEYLNYVPLDQVRCNRKSPGAP